MLSRISCLAAVAMAFPGVEVAAAQEAQMSANRLGYVFDEQAGQLRPVMGFPGAAYVGPAVETDLRGAWTSPDRQWHLVSREGSLELLSFRAESPKRIPISTGGQVIWSDDSAGFALYSRPEGSVRSWERDANGEWNLGATHLVDWSAEGRDVLPLAYDRKRGVLWYAVRQNRDLPASGAQESMQEGLYRLDLREGAPERVAGVTPGAGGLTVASLALARDSEEKVIFAEVSTRALYLAVKRGAAWEASPLYARESGGLEPTAVYWAGADTFLSAWKNRDPEESPLLIRHNLSAKPEEVLPLEEPVESIWLVPGNQFVQLRYALPARATLWFADFESRSVFFVPIPTQAGGSPGQGAGGENN